MQKGNWTVIAFGALLLASFLANMLFQCNSRNSNHLARLSQAMQAQTQLASLQTKLEGSTAAEVHLRTESEQLRTNLTAAQHQLDEMEKQSKLQHAKLLEAKEELEKMQQNERLRQANPVLPLSNVPFEAGSVKEPTKNLDCPVQLSYRIVTIPHTPAYTMFLYPPGQSFVADSLFTFSKTKDMSKVFESALQKEMEKRIESMRGRETNFLVLDIGVNIGLHAVYFASKGIEVHGFEPVSQTFGLLKCTKDANGFDHLHINNFGLGKEATRGCMQVNTGHWGGSFIAAETKTECTSGTGIRLSTLDTYVVDAGLTGRRATLVKVDVEGYELFALRGGEKLFAETPPYFVFAEVQPQHYVRHGEHYRDLLEFLWRFCYEIREAQSGKLLAPQDKHEETGGLFDIIAEHCTVKTPNKA